MNLNKLHAVFRICAASFFLATLFYPVSGIAAEVIVLVGSLDTKNSYHGRWLHLIYSELFSRLGYELQYDAYPSARASEISSRGLADGEINRVSMYGTVHPEVIRVDESHFQTTIAAYAVKPGITLNGWKSLKNTGYQVDYRRGTRIVEKALPLVLESGSISVVDTVEQGLKKLIRNRTDLYVDVDTIIAEKLSLLSQNDFDASMVYRAGILKKESLHVFLHKKNATLVPRVADELKAMKKEGLIELYKQQALEHRQSIK